MLSDRIVDVIGYLPSEMLGRFPWEFVPEESTAAFRSNLLEHLAKGKKVHLAHPPEAHQRRTNSLVECQWCPFL